MPVVNAVKRPLLAAGAKYGPMIEQTGQKILSQPWARPAAQSLERLFSQPAVGQVATRAASGGATGVGDNLMRQMMEAGKQKIRNLPQATREQVRNMGMQSSEMALVGANTQQQIASGEFQKMEQARTAGEIAQARHAIDPAQIPGNLENTAQRDVWKALHVEPSLAAWKAEQTRLGMPPTDAAVDVKRQELSAPIDAKFLAQDQAKSTKFIPGMANDDGTPNLNGGYKTDASTGYNPKNINDWLQQPGRLDAITTQFRIDADSIKKTTENLDPALKARLMTGKATDQDKLALQQQNVDVPKLTAQLGRQAQTQMFTSIVNDFGGDATAMKDFTATPQGMVFAAKKDPEIVAAAGEKVKTGEAPDMMTGLSQIWEGLGSTGQMLAVGGMALSAIGLFSSLMGEGGIGSMLMMLLGGGGLALAANKGNFLPQGASDFLNPILRHFGMSGLAGSAKPAATGAMVGANGEPLANPGGAAGKVGVNLDPAAMNALMAAPPAQQDAKLQEALQANPAIGPQLAGAAKHWGGLFQGSVMEKMQLAIPGITPQQAEALVNAYKRLPPEQQQQYLAQYDAS